MTPTPPTPAIREGLKRLAAIARVAIDNPDKPQPKPHPSVVEAVRWIEAGLKEKT